MEDLSELLYSARGILDQLKRQLLEIEQDVRESDWESKELLLQEIEEIRTKREEVTARVEYILTNDGNVLEKLRRAIDQATRDYWLMAQKTATGNRD